FHHLPGTYWTIEQYHAMIENGILAEDNRVELLFGKITPKMPIRNQHAKCVNKLNPFFHRQLGH
ncbi:MAG: Uma2 family endonuclease, partial [Bacteroidota bacterium]